MEANKETGEQTGCGRFAPPRVGACVWVVCPLPEYQQQNKQRTKTTNENTNKKIKRRTNCEQHEFIIIFPE